MPGPLIWYIQRMIRMLCALFVLVCVVSLTSCSVMRARPASDMVRDSIAGYRESMICMTPVYLAAPILCSPPASGPRMSRAGAGSPHGEKLYHLYVSDPDAYALAAVGSQDAPVGLTLVKEAHHVYSDIQAHGPTGTREVKRAGPISDLFVMMKVGEAGTLDTDAGWVYATASPFGEIESIGMIESCIRCHEEAENDRLFGLSPAATIYFAD